MMDVRVLRAGGLSDAEIVKILELEQQERAAARRETNRKSQQKHRARKRVMDDVLTGDDDLRRARRGGRGTRLPDDWAPSLADQDRALAIGLSEAQIQTEGEKFRDYWRARVGARATSTNWSLNWNNWCRNAMERYGNGHGHGINGKRSAIEIAGELADEIRARESAAGIGGPADLFGGR